MANPIVVVNVSQTQAPTPSTLQKTGALISQGGTSLGVGEYQLLTGPDDLEDLLPSALAVTSITWSSAYGGQATVTTTANHGVTVGQQFITTIAGATPSAYNGRVTAIATGAATFTYYLSPDPGTSPATGTITYTRNGVGELESMVDTFFAQQGSQLVYVLETGNVATATAVANLEDFIEASPQFFYSYLVPRAWDANSTFLTLLAEFEATDAKTYFFVTTNLQNYGEYTDLMKCVVALIEAPFYTTWAANTVSNATWSTGVATVTTGSAHGIAPGMTFTLTGIDPDGYNGTFIARPGTTGSTLTYAVASDPGAYDSGGDLVQRRYESDGVPATEFTLAAAFFVALNYNPTAINRLTSFAFSYLYGVTAFPTQGNSALLATIDAGNWNYVGTGAEGGITNTILYNGHTMDGRPFTYWYSVDWIAINVKRDVANAIINGANNPINPLTYNQRGIDRLQQAAADTAGRAITYGLALGKVIQVDLTSTEFSERLDRGDFRGNIVVNAIPFTEYATDHPSDIPQGVYDGIAISYPPMPFFERVTVNINVTDFV